MQRFLDFAGHTELFELRRYAPAKPVGLAARMFPKA
jgi:hypothetical protein